jgi:hypothetical protein
MQQTYYIIGLNYGAILNQRTIRNITMIAKVSINDFVIFYSKTIVSYSE